jgi:hypothetical protein
MAGERFCLLKPKEKMASEDYLKQGELSYSLKSETC